MTERMFVCVDSSQVDTWGAVCHEHGRAKRQAEAQQHARAICRTCVKKLTRRLSKSSPPRWVSPAVDFTSKMPSSMVSSDTCRHWDRATSMTKLIMGSMLPCWCTAWHNEQQGSTYLLRRVWVQQALKAPRCSVTALRSSQLLLAGPSWLGMWLAAGAGMALSQGVC